MKLLLSLLLSSLALTQIRAQPLKHFITDAWEPGEEGVVVPSISPPRYTPLVDFSRKMILLYQERISTASVSRCPFKISCSYFALRALEKDGFPGWIIFLDRYFYRENNELPLHYPLVITEEGLIKFDDSFYLYGG